MRSQDDLGEYMRAFLKISAVLIANKKVAEMERDMLYLNGFPSILQQKIWQHLLIVKQDLHPDDSYLMDNVTTVAKFLLTGSTFRSSLPPAYNPPRQSAPYQPNRASCQSTVPIPSYNPPPAIKVEYNQAVQSALLCKFCTGPGHHMRTCPVCLEYLNSGKVVRGTDGRLYMPDGLDILRIHGGRCFKDAIDHTLALRQSGQATTSSGSANTFSRDPPPHITAGILSAAYPQTPVVLDIDPSTFTFAETEMESPIKSSSADIDFQPYIAQAWASFQADKASKDKGTLVRFDGVQTPLRNKPTGRAAIVSEELLSPELQKSTKDKSLLPLSASTSSSTSGPRPTSSTSTSNQSGSSALRSAASSSFPPRAPQTNQMFAPKTQFKYSFPLEDEGVPRRVLDWVLDTSVPVPGKDLFVVSPEFWKQFRNITMVKRVTNPASNSCAGKRTIRHRPICGQP
jgi:hypothetical protein